MWNPRLERLADSAAAGPATWGIDQFGSVRISTDLFGAAAPPVIKAPLKSF